MILVGKKDIQIWNEILLTEEQQSKPADFIIKIKNAANTPFAFVTEDEQLIFKRGNTNDGWGSCHILDLKKLDGDSKPIKHPADENDHPVYAKLSPCKKYYVFAGPHSCKTRIFSSKTHAKIASFENRGY